MAASATSEFPTRAGQSAYAATLAVGGSALMGIGGLGAAYLAFRYSDPGAWVDPKMKFNNYVGVLALVSMLLAALSAGWAGTSARLGQRRWAATGFGLAVLFGLATLNLVWFVGKELGFGVDESGYSVMLYTLLFAGGLAVAAGVIAALAGLATTYGGHGDADSPVGAKPFVWGQYFATASWAIVFAIVFLKK